MNPYSGPTDSEPQDSTPGHRAYQAPIPPVDAGPAGHPGSEPRYLESEPLPNSPFGARGGSRCGGYAATPRRMPFGPFALAPGTLPRKSLALAALLALVLGPLGMVYSTIFGAFIMTGVVFWTALFTSFQGVPLVWLFGVFWAVAAAHRRNGILALVEQRLGR